MIREFCYNSPWCEPGEHCCCDKYADFEREEEETRKKKEEAMIPDHTIVTGMCWFLGVLLLFAVILENVTG